MKPANAPRLNAYDAIAPYYDFLAGLVFGKSIKRSQTIHIPSIPETGNVLILGGGTGWLLAEIINKKPKCNFWYVEASAGMIAAAQKVTGTPSNVHYFHGGVDRIPANVRFDVVVMHFFLDQFPEREIETIVVGLKKAMTINGRFLVADFCNERWWHRVLLSVMYLFFGAFGAVNVHVLPRWQEVFSSSGFRETSKARFYNGFIKSAVYGPAD